MVAFVPFELDRLEDALVELLASRNESRERVEGLFSSSSTGEVRAQRVSASTTTTRVLTS